MMHTFISSCINKWFFFSGWKQKALSHQYVRAALLYYTGGSFYSNKYTTQVRRLFNVWATPAQSLNELLFISVGQEKKVTASNISVLLVNTLVRLCGVSQLCTFAYNYCARGVMFFSTAREEKDASLRPCITFCSSVPAGVVRHV